ncbi:MAG: epoxyqueuosine reductase [Nanoarchaeota archaeon]|nr:epoxyqueuosine reductase [Nanoarchaeota archaeon]
MYDLKKQIYRWGASLVGFADLKEYIPDNLKPYPNAISIAVKLDDKIINKVKEGPTKEYIGHYHDINNKLNEIAKRTEGFLVAQGYDVYVIEASKRIKPNILRGEIPHKTAATRSGLGWIGKTALLVTRSYGPRIRLVTVLTNAPLKFNKPMDKSKCGNCQVCVEKCPANSSKNTNWKPGMKREEIFDPYACEKMTQILGKKFNFGMCGICVSVCPFGKTK